MKIARHLEACHSTETEVERAIQQPKDSVARRVAWSAIHNEGDYTHNYSVFKDKQGLILPKYRPSCRDRKDPTEYLPCGFCKALYNAKELNAHQNRCDMRTGTKSTKQNQAVRQGKLLLPMTDEESSSFFSHVVNSMNNDDVAKVARNVP